MSVSNTFSLAALGDGVFERLWPDLWGTPQWFGPAIALAIVLVALQFWSSRRGSAPAWVLWLGSLFKTLAILLLVAVLLEPMAKEESVEPRANIVVLLADNSFSLTTSGPSDATTWATEMQNVLDPLASWRQRLESDFDVRTFQFDHRVEQVARYDKLNGDGTRSDLQAAIEQISERFADRPVAGVVVLTDGVSTDGIAKDANRQTAASEVVSTSASSPFPIYPIAFGSDSAIPDIRVSRVTASETNFEAAPVTVSAEIRADGYAGKTVVAKLLNENNEIVAEQRIAQVADGRPFAVRFRAKPESGGVQFYRVEAALDEADQRSSDAERTTKNNSRNLVVDRSGGPYRVLYVSGRPNWEFKFLRRAVEQDDEVDLVGLIRIAKKQPKFTFRSTDSDSNPLFRGFESDEEQAEAYDEPVMLRVGTQDAEELRTGFPKTAEDLFAYHAVIVDDVEAAFFTQDQKDLLQEFVNQRGGGFLMLGGQETFQGGGYARTSIGELLPVYADRVFDQAPPGEYRIDLTREGWLEPWTRLRPTEADERKRLAQVPPFATMNRLASIKPGARVLAEVSTENGVAHPALVTQPFGRGRTAALLIGDLWKWHLQRETPESDDFAKAWRQTLRWLVAEVPNRVEVKSSTVDQASGAIEYRLTVRDDEYRLLDNAEVQVEVTDPAGDAVSLAAVPVVDQSGEYALRFVPRTPGPYRALFTASGPDGSPVGAASGGLIYDPTADELRQLNIDRPLLETLATNSGGEVIQPATLDQFAESLATRKAPITQMKVVPIWHHWIVLVAAIALLVAEWGLRRWKGLP